MQAIKTFIKQILFHLIALVPRKRPDQKSTQKLNGLNLIGPEVDSGLGFVTKHIQDSLKSEIRVNRIFFSKFSLWAGQRFFFKNNIFVCSPNMMLRIPLSPSIFSFYNSRNIGLFFWELERPSEEWRWLKTWMDEVWVHSDFLVKSFSKMFRNVHKIPFTLNLKLNKKLNRSYFKLPQNAFIFIFNFDYWSVYERKNPEGVVRAFKMAFGDRRNVHLLIKSTHAKFQPEDANNLRSLIGSAKNIELRDVFISSENMMSLINLCDCYVSLHRAEGLGLGMAEAMALGKPVIATNYSGNLEFMSDHNSCLVGYKKIPIKKNAYPHCNRESNNGDWADPNIKQAADYMKKIKDNKVFREKIAKQALMDMKRFTLKNQQQAILKRLGASYA
jgi:glycosyltransferase involved in cell wall biosynthesis